jgi:FecR-like protein
VGQHEVLRTCCPHAMKLSPSGDFMTSQAHHWLMKRLVLILPLFAGHLSVLRAEPFEQAEVKKAINVVSLLPQDVRAAPGDIVKGDTALQTGGNSRAELQFPDLTITRVGSNALFRFIAGTREMILDSGTLLFSSPAGAGGGKVQAGAITAAVTGTDFMISNVGTVKVICLSHKVTVYLTANPKIRAELLPGQMLDITPGTTGAVRKMPPVTTINLGKLLATSLLKEAGGFTPLPSQAILTQNANKQGKAFSLANTSLTSESAEMVRSTTAVTDNPPSQPLQTAAATTARESAATRNNENRGNAGNNENRGNAGNNENRGNAGNNENRGNSENRGNNSNIRNIENRGNSGNAPGRAGK